MTKKATENIKSVILVVLFLLTILLLYLLFGGKGEVKISSLIPDFSGGETSIAAKDYIVPSKIYYTEGDGSFKMAEELKANYDRYNALFKKLCDESSVMATEISREQFDLAVKQYQSVRIVFSYDILFSDYCDIFEISRSSTFANVEYLSAFILSSAAPDSIIIEDKRSGKYFRLLPDVSADFSEEIKPLGEFYPGVYYEASTVLGQGGSNLFPLIEKSILSKGSCSQSHTDSEFRKKIAEIVFGDTFDFVRRISDSFGNYTFMYGYGQKTLSLMADGCIEYKQEVNSQGSKGLLGDLETALVFYEKIIACEDTLSTIVLDSIKTEGSGKNAVRSFAFIQKLDGLEVRTNNDYAVLITVDGGEVSYFKMNWVTEEGIVIEAYRPVMDAANAMAASARDGIQFAILAENYVNIKPVYYAKDESLIPSWMLVLSDNSRIYYDLYTGEVLN